MLFFGSTPLSYAVAFSLSKVISRILISTVEVPAMAGIIDLNSPKYACPLTGFLPLHVAVANSLTSMFNFLTDLPGLPMQVGHMRVHTHIGGETRTHAQRVHAHAYTHARMHTQVDDMRAQPEALSHTGRKREWAIMSPLQLAVQLGDQRMVQYIMRTDSACEWVWGPVSAWYIDLRGIDSIGDTGNDVLEILARTDNADTQRMLLDDFVEGIFHQLFVQKFRQFGMGVFGVMRLFDLLYLTAISAVAHYMKTDPIVLFRSSLPLSLINASSPVANLPQSERTFIYNLPYLALGLMVGQGQGHSHVQGQGQDHSHSHGHGHGHGTRGLLVPMSDQTLNLRRIWVLALTLAAAPSTQVPTPTPTPTPYPTPTPNPDPDPDRSPSPSPRPSPSPNPPSN